MASLSSDKLFNVNGMVAVVTGGGSGIGMIMARALAANGADKVYIVGRRAELLEEVASSCPTKNIIALPGDVTSKESLMQAAARVKAEVGFINLLVANSGVMGSPVPLLSEGSDMSQFVQAMWNTPMEDMTNTFNVNVTGAFYTVVAFLELLDAGNKKGNLHKKLTSQVIATGSIGAFSRKAGSSFAYNSSKMAITHLMKMLSSYLVPWDIRCNVLAPGLFPSDLAMGLINNQQSGEEDGRPVFPRNFIPVRRVGDEEDMAGTILYLASIAGAYCNGTVLVMDGGRLGVLTSSY